jgi:hypothetical protein
MRTVSRSRLPWLGSLVGLLATTSLGGCAAHLTEHVPSEAIAKLPLECRLTLLDAESEVLAAQDVRDAQEEATAAARESVAVADRRVDTAETNLKKARSANENVDIANAAVTEAESRLAYARADDELQHARLETTDAALLLAQARFEFARAHEVDAAGQSGVWSVRVQAYTDQVARISRHLDETKLAEQRVQTNADESRKAWSGASEKLAGLTGGAQGSVWVQ